MERDEQLLAMELLFPDVKSANRAAACGRTKPSPPIATCLVPFPGRWTNEVKGRHKNQRPGAVLRPAFGYGR